MMKVVKIDINDKIYGGRVYENEMIHLLEGEVKFERVFIMKHNIRIFNIFRLLFLFIRYKFFYNGVLLLTNSTTFFAGLRSKNIVVIHHIDSHFSWSPVHTYEHFCNLYLYNFTFRFDTVVVVAEIWRQKMLERGFKNVVKIYNSFNPADYSFGNEEIRSFKEKYNLLDKPIVYLGNGRKGKGADKCYECLKDMNVHFVTSGGCDFDIPSTNLNLPFREYKLLLAASNVVLTMSEFSEGWNRTAHEAALCGTPVIGTGYGGMKELLEMSGNTISTFSDLRANVESSLYKTVPANNQIKSLNLEYFKREWGKVFE